MDVSKLLDPRNTFVLPTYRLTAATPVERLSWTLVQRQRLIMAMMHHHTVLTRKPFGDLDHIREAEPRRKIEADRLQKQPLDGEQFLPVLLDNLRKVSSVIAHQQLWKCKTVMLERKTYRRIHSININLARRVLRLRGQFGEANCVRHGE